MSVSRSRHLGCTCETHEFWRPARRAIKDDYAGQVHIEAMTVEPEPQCAAAELAIVEETPVEALASDSATIAVVEETAATACDGDERWTVSTPRASPSPAEPRPDGRFAFAHPNEKRRLDARKARDEASKMRDD